ncbi:MAG: Tetratricopeptide repeat protein [Candidatus Nitrosotenuis sp.]|nr:Tetratricopeptide repeat protein [Candidatus Nitrosotenuis sp.]
MSPFYTRKKNPGVKKEESVDRLIAKGMESLNIGNFKVAMRFFDKALELEPDNTDALLYKADAISQLKKKKLAST